MFTLEFVGWLMVLGMYVAVVAAVGASVGVFGSEWWWRRRLWRWPAKPRWFRERRR